MQHKGHGIPLEESKAKSAAAFLSIITAIFLVLLKAVSGYLTGSISVLASLLDSTLDIFASTLNYFAIRVADRPADEDHAYGHGKVESLGGLFQALVIGASGLFLIWEAIWRIKEPHETSSEGIGIGTMIIAIIVCVALVRRLKRVARETESPALASDAAHYVADIFINAGVLIALLVTTITGWHWVDPAISIAIALYILWSAIHVGHEAVDVLTDRRLPPEIDEQVTTIVARFREHGVRGFHDLRTRRSGSSRFIDLHLEIDRNLRFDEAHGLSVQVLRRIEAEIPRTKVHVHADPA